MWTPRSYHIRICTLDDSIFRRNRRHLLHVPKCEENEQTTTTETTMTNVERLHESPRKVTHERNAEQRLITEHVTKRSRRAVKNRRGLVTMSINKPEF